mgnify:CR=1 FL=1
MERIWSLMIEKNEKTVVGLTGAIASGKSSVLNLFAKLGWSVISSDVLAHEILAFDKMVQQKIVKHWGKGVLKSSGSIDKAVIARIVFEEELERKWLEGILHPLIRSKWISFVQSCPSQKCMVELPLLFENSLQIHFTYTISLFTPIPMIHKRLQNRGLSRPESDLRIRSQFAPLNKAELADYVLWGGASMEFLSKQVNKLNSAFA